MTETGSFQSVSNWTLLDYTAQSTVLELSGKYFTVVSNNLQETVARWDIQASQKKLSMKHDASLYSVCVFGLLG